MASIRADYHRYETKNSRKPVPAALSKSQVLARLSRRIFSNGALMYQRCFGRNDGTPLEAASKAGEKARR
jgi:hypothetical protein